LPISATTPEKLTNWGDPNTTKKNEKISFIHIYIDATLVKPKTDKLIHNRVYAQLRKVAQRV
jgi:hypothetical protein